MFDIGWTEMLVVACVAIIVVGPKDLPKMLRAFGKTVGNVKRMAGDFQKQFDEALKEAELDEVRNLSKGKGFSALDDVKESTQKFQREMKEQMSATEKDINKAAKPDAGSSSTEVEAPAAKAESLPEPKADSGSKNQTAATSAKSGAAKASASKPAAKKSTTSAKSGDSGSSTTSAAAKKPATRKQPSSSGKSSGAKSGKSAKNA